MKAIRRALLLAPALCLLSGCGLGSGIYANYRPIEELQLVETLGVDALEGGGVTLSAAAGKSGEKGTPAVLRAAADDLVQGLDALQSRNVRGQVFFAHTRFVVLGEAYAERGVGALLDYIARDHHTRMGAELFVLRDGAAASLVTGAGADWDVSGVLSSVRSETERTGGSQVFTVRETAVALEEDGAALVCALRLVGTEGGVYAVEPGLSAVPEGYAVLRGDSLAGYLDGGEARAAGLLLGVLGETSVTLPEGDAAVTLTVRCERPTLRFTPGADGVPAALELRAEPEAVIAAADGGSGDFDAAALEAALNAALRADAEAVLARAKAMNADFLGLHRALRRQGMDPDALPPDWLRTLAVHVTVDARIVRSGDLEARSGAKGGAAP